MEIKTLFNVGDLVVDKHMRPEVHHNGLLAYEVLEVATQTCYAGTQVFYDVAMIHCQTDDRHYIRETPTVTQVIYNHRKSNELYIRIREDQLKPCAEEIENLIRGKSKI